MTVLELRDLTVHIGSVSVVDRVSLSLGAGDRVGLIGESGSGKTLTALAALGLLPETARPGGGIELCGQSVQDLSERQWARQRSTEACDPSLVRDKFPNKATHCEPSMIDSENRLTVRKLIETM